MKTFLYNIRKIEIISKKSKKYKQCEKIMLKIEQPLNIKPDEWYEEIERKYDELVYSNDLALIPKWEVSLEQRIERLKSIDKDIILLNKIDAYVTPLWEKFYELKEKIFRERSNQEYRNGEEYQRDKEQMHKCNDMCWNSKGSEFTEDEFFHYNLVIDCSFRIPNMIFNCNSFEKNKGVIEILKYRFNSLKEQPDFSKLESYKLMGWDRCLLFDKVKLGLCEEILNQGYLVTGHLEELLDRVKEYEYDLEPEARKKPPRTISDLAFTDFNITQDTILSLIRKNEKWHDIDRDITVYQERQKGKYLQELADNFGIKFNSISMVVKKVQSAINYYKGKLFEDFVEKRLKESGLFKEVVKEAGKGEPDILAYSKDDKKLFIYSLKNIKIDRNPYWLITKEELLPELKDSKLCSLDYDTHLILLVYDNHNKRVLQREIDYNNLENINLATIEG